MPKSNIFLFNVIVTIIFSNGSLCAQGLLDGFMRGRGQIATAISYSNESYDTYFVGANKTQNENLGSIKTSSYNFFASGGLTDFLDLVVSIPYIKTKASQGFWSNQENFQDISLFLKGQFFEKSFSKGGKFSMLGGLGVTAPISDYIADAPVSIGSQSTQWDGRLISQYRNAHGVFIMGQLGYSKRGNVRLDRGFEVSVPDAWDYIIKIGGNYKKIYGDAWFQYQNSRTGTNIGPGVPFPGNEIDFKRIGFTLYRPVPKFENFGVSLSAGFTLAGMNVGLSNRFSASLVYNFAVSNLNQ